MRATAAGSRWRAATRSAWVGPPLVGGCCCSPNPSTGPPQIPRRLRILRGVRLSDATDRGHRRFGARLVHRKSPDLVLALKPPQNVTDVITIVSFNRRF